MTPCRFIRGSAKSLIAAEHFNRRAAERGLALQAVAAATEPGAADRAEIEWLIHDTLVV